MEEVYKVIEGFDNYEVSNLGNVRNVKTQKVLKGRKNTHGYHSVSLYKNDNASNKLIHRLVAGAFLDNADDKECVDHIDNNRINNCISNLRYATKSENQYNRIMNVNNTSGFKGVSFHAKRKKWDASIKIDGITIHLGQFINKEDAILARITKANQVFGSYKNVCETI